jgi:uncharacterized membrane protein
MQFVEIVLLVVAIVILVVGYQKNKRNWLLLGAVLLFFAGSAGDFVHGFVDGLMQSG